MFRARVLQRALLPALPLAALRRLTTPSLYAPPTSLLGAADAGRRVKLSGWVSSVRSLGDALVFLTLRDAHGSVQIVFDDAVSNNGDSFPGSSGGGCGDASNEDVRTLLTRARALRLESVVSVSGVVRTRKSGAGERTAAVEIASVDGLTVHASPTRPLALSLRATGGGDAMSEESRLAHRVLDLRRGVMARNLRLRSSIGMAVRAAFVAGAGDASRPFCEIETPALVRSSPEGAREFLVFPAGARGRAFALSQSPQQHKQLLIAGGVERYFQFARCFRDESGRGDRQSEFTQIDFEMSFPPGGATGVRGVVEVILRAAWRAAADAVDGRVGGAGDGPPLIRWAPLTEAPFERITFAHSLATYGTDKPDRRIGLPIVDVTDHVGSELLGGALQTAITRRWGSADTSLDGLLDGVKSVRAIRVPRLGDALSRSKFTALADLLLLETSGTWGGSAGVELLRVAAEGDDGGGVTGRRYSLRGSGGAARALSASGVAALTRELGAGTGDAIAIAWGSQPQPILHALGVARGLLAQASIIARIPLNPHATPVGISAAEPLESLARGRGVGGARALARLLGGGGGNSSAGERVGDFGGGEAGEGVSEVGADVFWVDSFPLFEDAGAGAGGEDGGLRATHHPFTAPVDSCASVLREALELDGGVKEGAGGVQHLSDASPPPALPPATKAQLLTVIGNHYDVVCNGVELGGGSVRIHDAHLQRTVLARVLRAPLGGFSALLSALESGAPPHAGAAIGFDRLVATLAGPLAATSLRDVIAFPKSAAGNDALLGAPAAPTDAQLHELGIYFSGKAQ